MEKKSSRDTGKDTERAGHRKIDQDSGRMEMENTHPGWSTGQKGIGIWASSGTNG